MRATLLAVGLMACADPPTAPPVAPPPPQAAPAAPAAPLIDESDVVMGLVQAPGRDKVLATCLACHSTALITQNRMTRERWDHTLTWMQETQGLWPIPPEDRALILDYLSLTQGIDAPRADSPWAEPLYAPNPIW